MADYRRVQAPDVATAPDIQVYARPLDSYVRPGPAQISGLGSEAGDSSINALADALKILSPIAQGTISEVHKEYSAEEIAKGRLAREANQQQFKSAGIFGAQNPWFVKGYMQADGKLSGEEFYQSTTRAWQEQGIGNKDDIGAFNQFMTEQKKAWIERNSAKSSDWRDGFMPELAKAENNLLNHHISTVQARIETTAKDNFGVLVAKSLSDQFAREADPGAGAGDTGAQRAAVAADLQAQGTEWVKRGMRGQDVNSILTKQILAAAVENHDTTLIEGPNSLIAQIKTPGGSIAQIADIKKAIDDTSQHIRALVRQDKINAQQDEDRPFAVEARDMGRLQREHTVKEWEVQQKSQDRTERARGLYSELMADVLESKAINHAKLLRLNADSPQHAESVLSFKHTRATQSAEIITDQRAAAKVFLQIATDSAAVDNKTIYDGVAGGRWSLGVAENMMNTKRSLEAPGADVVSRDPYFQSYLHSLTGSIGGDGLGTADGKRNAGLAAVEYRLLAVDIYKDKNLTEGQRIGALKEASDKVLARYPLLNTTGRTGTPEDQAAKAQALNLKPGPKELKLPVYTPPGTTKSIPWAAVDHLYANPNTAAQFDQAFGLTPGTATRMLAVGRQRL